MPKAQDITLFHLPDLGEGLAEAEIRVWHVKVGDKISADTPLVSMETAKAIVDVPSPYTGVIEALYGKEGDIIKTGEKLAAFSSVQGRVDTGTVAGKLDTSDEDISWDAKVAAHSDPRQEAPSTSKRRELNGIRSLMMDTTDWEMLKGLRRSMAQSMTMSHQHVVPVTVHDEVDISRWSEQKDMSIALMRALVEASSKEPSVNAWYDGENNRRLCHASLHIGIAVDTPEGLLVPVLHFAEKQNDKQLRESLNTLKKGAHERTLAPEMLKGATIVLSNFGTMAGRYATPIILPPMVAILGVGKAFERAQYKNSQWVNARYLPLSLTVDHRCVTGGEATRFLAALMASLSKA